MPVAVQYDKVQPLLKTGSQAEDSIILSQNEINQALVPYHKEFRMVKSAEYRFDHRIFSAEILPCRYPFTFSPMSYASINLVNLAIEQALLVQMRYEISSKMAQVKLWNNIQEYDKMVSSGHWLVPKLITKLHSTVPTNRSVFLEISIKKDLIKRSSYWVFLTLRLMDSYPQME